jgi:copper oxidase (laccase) domain-containing protein
MTRKDYVILADVLAKFTAEGGVVVERDAMAYDLADALGADNPRFDRERFLVAAGVWEKCNYCTARASSFSSSLQWCASHRGKGLIAHGKVSA